MNKKFLFAMIAGVLATNHASLAAIDDAGMRYISASEGLSGSIRIRIIDDNDGRQRDDEKPRLNFGTSRLVYRGENDLGGGMAATYYMEVRPENGNSTFSANYIDAGVRGSFGHFRFGEIESASESLMPTADLTSDIGTSGRKLADDYARGIRWVSPDINGLMMGVSADTHREFDANQATFDQYDLVALYSLSWGVDLGASYSVIPHPTTKTSVDGNKKGFRVGTSYIRENWGIAYNFHRYASAVTELVGGYGFEIGRGGGVVSASNLDKHKDSRYNEHVISANLKLGRFGFAVNHSRGSLENSEFDIDDSIDGKQIVDVDLTYSALDIEYRLGSKTKMIAAYSIDEINGGGYIRDPGPDFHKIKSYYLLYRIDF